MAELFATGRVVDLILGLVALEALFLALHRRWTGRGTGLGAVLPSLLAGALLLLALRAALLEAAWTWIALCLGASLLAHLADLRSRWQGRA